MLSDRPKGYRFPTVVIARAVYLYHRFTLSYRDVQELLSCAERTLSGACPPAFERGVDVGHETIGSWCQRFGPEYVQGLQRREGRRGRTWHLDEVHVALGGQVHWLWRAVNEYDDVLEVLLQKSRSTEAAKRFFRRLLDEHDIPERISRTSWGATRPHDTNCPTSGGFGTSKGAPLHEKTP